MIVELIFKVYRLWKIVSSDYDLIKLFRFYPYCCTLLVYIEGFTAISHWLYRIFIFHPTKVPLFFPKCLWKLARFVPDIIQDLNVDAVLLDIHIFLKKYPSSYWKTKEDQRPMTTITVFLRTLMKLLGAEVSSLLFVIPVHVRRHVRSHMRVPTHV